MYDPTESVQPLVASTLGPPVRPSERPTSINRCRSASNPARSIERYASHLPSGEQRGVLSAPRPVVSARIPDPSGPARYTSTFLLPGPLDVARDEEPRAVGEPQRIEHAVGQTRHAARLASGNRKHPQLRAVLARGYEGEGAAVGRPARLPIRSGTRRELAHGPARHVREPDARDTAVVLEGLLGDGVRDPFPVGRELWVAHRLEREIVVDGDRALLGGKTGKREKGNGNRETSQRDQ